MSANDTRNYPKLICFGLMFVLSAALILGCSDDSSTDSNPAPPPAAPAYEPSGTSGSQPGVDQGTSNWEGTPAAQTTAAADLQIQSWKVVCNPNFCTATGTVENTSDSSLSNVEVSVTGEDSAGNMVSHVDSMIDDNPVLPNQVSKFQAIFQYNSNLKKSKFGFHYLDGTAIPMTKKSPG